jgi:hypothetical protein
MSETGRPGSVNSIVLCRLHSSRPSTSTQPASSVLHAGAPVAHFSLSCGPWSRSHVSRISRLCILRFLASRAGCAPRFAPSRHLPLFPSPSLPDSHLSPSPFPAATPSMPPRLPSGKPVTPSATYSFLSNLGRAMALPHADRSHYGYPDLFLGIVRNSLKYIRRWCSPLAA